MVGRRKGFQNPFFNDPLFRRFLARREPECQFPKNVENRD